MNGWLQVVSSLLFGLSTVAQADQQGATSSAKVKAEDARHITVQRARSLYMLHCAGCHRFDGSGAPNSGVPTLVNTLGKYQLTAQGRAYLVQVPGARNAGVTDAELAAMTNWQMQAFSAATIPAGFTPYTAEEVRRMRSDAPADIAGARAAILADLPLSLTDDPNEGKK